VRWSRREGGQEGSGRSREAFAERLPGPDANGQDVWLRLLLRCCRNQSLQQDPAVPDAKHLGCRCRRITAADPDETKLAPLPFVPSPNDPFLSLGRGQKGSIRAAILDPTTGAKMMALQVIPMIACDKEKEWRVDTLESLPSFYQRPKIWLLWFVLLSSDP
jgi:hypothetical protein